MSYSCNERGPPTSIYQLTLPESLLYRSGAPEPWTISRYHHTEMLDDKCTSTVDKLEDKDVRELCADYANYTRVNISEEHGQVSLSHAIEISKIAILDSDPDSCY